MKLLQKVLAGVIGGKNDVSEILNRKKRLTVEMVRKLTEILTLPSEILIQDYQLVI